VVNIYTGSFHYYYLGKVGSFTLLSEVEAITDTVAPETE
jgi:hypothetical protein